MLLLKLKNIFIYEDEKIVDIMGNLKDAIVQFCSL